eukprot:1708433-Rhodomonas_salina.3
MGGLGVTARRGRGQVRRDSSLEKATAKQFMLGLNSDLLPLRQLCRAVLPLLKLSESVASGRGDMDVDGGGRPPFPLALPPFMAAALTVVGAGRRHGDGRHGDGGERAADPRDLRRAPRWHAHRTVRRPHVGWVEQAGRRCGTAEAGGR